MSIRLDLPALSRRRPAKFALASLIAVVAIALVTFTTRAWRAKTISTTKHGVTAVQPTPARGRLQNRLALQPEADKLRRRLGQRFLAPGREVSTLIGTLNLGADRQTVRIVRSQDDDDERLTIALGGGPPSLTWGGVDGAKSGGALPTGALRALIERLALDSPDQFVMAQLRGASYHTVARDVRPAEAGGSADYTGPRWDLVRVAEPSRLTQNRPQSLWRLYYINSSTGLIDKVISQEQGLTITSEFSGWVNQGGETVPIRTIWKLNSQTVMELNLTNITHNPKQ
ncbi:MAG: hypothetical protein MOB07_22500 [Acidobacteria bacterium]|nr:hypothetical protein [Acidobacteriota bacterium]